ncbi:branched-chain amino acid ABC transporter permease [Geodermatophilus ruber]|uniref:Amino acid/amide ABC transporter membrane protein 2, HAAT family n=1 Tax=Geodermatophilus ruber TaxID=504800 RepID=A0A1I4BYP7_9ACTN|nr:branched-chain amino acid ABC transporter permease [Geodermatophilus ruber]SFK73520.1 amino acid/amide ABC transporter membrane protein 2, HAAT family [Geodermatophilus ruber]
MSAVAAGVQRSRWPVRLAWVVGMVLVALLAFVITDYELFRLSRMACIGIAVLSLDLLTGRAGLISAGQGALFGLGAYTTVLLVYHEIAPYPVAIVLGSVLCFLVGLVLGLPALRLGGLNLGLVTLGAALVFPELLKKYSDLTGGVFGIGISPPQAPLDLALTSAQWLYLVSVAGLLIAMAFYTRLVNSRFGRGLEALRTNENMAASVGVDLARSKLLAFGISSAMAGFGGGLYLLLIGHVTPDTFLLTLSLSMLFAAVVGGLRSRLGVLLGAAFVVFVPDFSAAFGERGPQLIYAIALLLTVYLLPRGIVPSLAALGRRLLGRRAPRTPEPWDEIEPGAAVAPEQSPVVDRLGKG